jgi:hypothetical protein
VTRGTLDSVENDPAKSLFSGRCALFWKEAPEMVHDPILELLPFDLCKYPHLLGPDRHRVHLNPSGRPAGASVRKD